ncbi:unnamed protein product [Cuscuta europaea]|uniref:Uncharacterized protein n=1 Tax=Cuscuta europaea TaxID=41803 RepID=A0A9P1EJ83_CUSEU|nr:unnamed protein product [Cuscuta europaea]
MRSPPWSAAVAAEDLLLFFEVAAVAKDEAAEDGSTPAEAGSAAPAAGIEKSKTRSMTPVTRSTSATADNSKTSAAVCEQRRSAEAGKRRRQASSGPALGLWLPSFKDIFVQIQIIILI